MINFNYLIHLSIYIIISLVSLHKSTLYQSMVNFKLTTLMLLFYSCMIIMVSCESGRHQDEGNVHHDYMQKNEFNEVRDSKDITEVKYLKEIVLDEKSLLDFPIQEYGHIKWINIAESISHCEKFGLQLLGLERISDVNSIVKENQDVAYEVILLKWLKMEGANNEPITF